MNAHGKPDNPTGEVAAVRKAGVHAVDPALTGPEVRERTGW